MGPVILARALGADFPYAVKVHGIALDHIKPCPEAFLGFAPRRGGRAGSSWWAQRHTAESLLGGDLRPAAAKSRTRLGPPGVDVERSPPEPVHAAAGGCDRGALSAGVSVQMVR